MGKYILANGNELDLRPLQTLHEDISRALARVVVLRTDMGAGLRRLDALKDEGVDFSRPVFQGPYLYRAQPTDADGKRRRRYVGPAPDDVKAALAAMERGRQYCDEAAKLRALVRQIVQAQRHASRLVAYLEALKPV